MNVNFEVQSICLPQDNLRGIEHYMIDTISALSKRGKNHYSVSYFDKDGCRNNGAYVKEYLKDVIEKDDFLECKKYSYREVLDGLYKGSKGSYCQDTYDTCINRKADVYHFLHSMYLPQNVEGRVIVTVHDILPVLKQFQMQFSEYDRTVFQHTMEMIIENEYEIVTISEHTKKDLIETYQIGKSKINTVYNGYSTDMFYPESQDKINVTKEKYNIKQRYLLYLGAIDIRKGIVDLVEAYKKIKNDNDVTLVIAGSVNPNQKEKLKDVLKVIHEDERIIQTGYVSDQDKRALMSGAECFLFPSEYEGFGLPVLEAMACNCPVITTDVASLPEVGGDAVCYVKPYDSDALAEKTSEVLNNTNLIKIMKEKGITRSKMFTWEKTAEQLELIYSKSV